MKRLHAGRGNGRFCFLAAASLIGPVYADLTPTTERKAGILEEVIVTARKIRENAQDVPLSIQVLTGERLDEIDLTVLFDLQYEVPGLVVNSAGLHGAGFALRGVADQGGTSTSVATHLNGVYLGTSQLALARLFDLERIEVLKGPQGTLYGRNSTGGTLNFITRAPEGAFGGELEGAFGSFDTVRLQGHLNAPLGDSAAARFAFIGSEGDGFIRNTVDDRRFAEQDYWGLRGTVRFEPGEDWRIDFVAQRSYDDGASAELWLPNPEFLPDPGNIHLTTVTLANPFLRIENDNVSLTVDYNLGPANFRSVTGYANGEVTNLDDCAGLPALQTCVRGGDPYLDEQWSQEVQLASAHGGQIDWLAGAYFFSSESDRHFFQLLPLRSPRPLVDQFSTSDDTVWAVYGQGTLHFGDRWGVTGGLRYSDEASMLTNVGTGVFDNPQLVVLEDDRDHVSWRLDLAYNAHETLLLYTGVSTGFKSGGATAVFLPEGGHNRFDPEDLLAFETGLKGQWPGRGLVLDAAAFCYDFDDLQVTSVEVVDGRGFSVIENASGAVVYGLDLSGNLQMAEQLGLSGGLVWLPKREFVDYTSPRTGQDLSGNELSRAPEWSGIVSLHYRTPLAGRGELSARLEYAYRGKYYYTKENIESQSQAAHGLLNLLLRFEPIEGNWYAFASGRNLTDEDYFHQVFIQSTPGYPDTYEVGLGFRF